MTAYRAMQAVHSKQKHVYVLNSAPVLPGCASPVVAGCD